jgi:hypothetical protein
VPNSSLGAGHDAPPTAPGQMNVLLDRPRIGPGLPCRARHRHPPYVSEMTYADEHQEHDADRRTAPRADPALASRPDDPFVNSSVDNSNVNGYVDDMSAEDERLDQLLKIANDPLANKFEAARLYAAQAEDEGVRPETVVLVMRMLGAVREECDHIEVRMTESLMDAGLSWEEVGRATGRPSKQAAQQRYRRLGGTRTWPTRRPSH